MSDVAEPTIAAEETRTPRRPARAEQVGSLLRPRELLDEAMKIYEPGHRALLGEEREKDLSALRDLEDRLIPEIVQRQIDAGLDVVTDGEFRRAVFTNSFFDAIDGTAPPGQPYAFHDDQGNTVEHPGLPRVERRLRKIDNPALREATFMRSLTDYPFKITFPAGSWFWLPFYYQPGSSPDYPTRESLLDHTLEIERELVSETIDAGATHVQFDFPPYPFACDARWREQMPQFGMQPEEMVEKSLEADRAILDGIPEGVTTALHVCRGNYKSRWLADGSLEPVAERMFQLPYDVFLVEWEDMAREGDYSALRFVPKGPLVVMGIMSSKSPKLESEDDLLQSMEEAAKFVPMEQLAISPQCGFASAMEGNLIGEDMQWRKLEVLGRVADRIWGRS